MISINEYIKKFTPDQIGRNQEFYEQLMEYYGENNIPNKYEKLYSECKLSYEYIDENLKTHDINKLKNQLTKIYGDEIDDFIDYDGNDITKSFWIVINNNIKNPKLNIIDIRNHQGDTENFFNLLNFFNYTYREYKILNKHICLFIEPIYSEDASKYFETVHRQAYHFTYKENVDKILKDGIRLRDKTSSIKYPKRIYLWAEYKKLQKSIDINKFIKKILGDNMSLDNVGIIKVDLNNVHFPIYKDTAMTEKEAIFVYNNIPANLCKEIKLNI